MSWPAVNHKAELTAGSCGVTGLTWMTLASILMVMVLCTCFAAIVKFSYEIGKQALKGHKEIKCPTDRVDPGKSHGNVEPHTMEFDLT